MSDRARALALAFAVLGDRATVAECAALAEVEEPAGVIDELVVAGVLADDPELRFRHPLIAAAVAAGLPAARRERWHARAAALLRGGAARTPSGWRVHLAAVPAGRRGRRGRHPRPRRPRRRWRAERRASAEPLLRRALREPPEPGRRAGVLLALGDVLTVAGDREAAPVFAEAARWSDDPLVQARALEARAWWWALVPETVDRDLAEIDRLIAALPAGADDVRARIEAVRLAAASRSAPAMAQAVAASRSDSACSPRTGCSTRTCSPTSRSGAC